MDAFSRIQLREDTGKWFKPPSDIPTSSLTKGCLRDWLGAQRNPHTTISPAWKQYKATTPFMEAHTTGINEFQTLLPVNIHVKVNEPYSPPNGLVISRNTEITRYLQNRGTGWMLRFVENTLLGAAAGTDESGRALLMYHMQMPPHHKNIRPLSETLEIVYTGKYSPIPSKDKHLDIIITMTWVINPKGSGVKERYRDHPYLRITLAIEPPGRVPSESRIWYQAYHKLLQYQLMCPV